MENKKTTETEKSTAGTHPVQRFVMSETLENKTAAALAHRACCGSEHNPQNGKLHGYCVVCGVPWPCKTASTFLYET